MKYYIVWEQNIYNKWVPVMLFETLLNAIEWGHFHMIGHDIKRLKITIE